MRFLTPLVCGAAAFIAASSAHAMDYSYRVFGKQIVIDATGEIEMDEASRLSNWLSLSAQSWGHRRAYTIVFDSPGGAMYGGVKMADIVARHGLNTGVAHGGECASACVMAWAAGVHKSTATDARIGVHMARDGDYQIASDATLFYAQFVKRTGAPASVVAGLVSTPPQEVYWLSLAELRAWNTTIVDEADTPLNRAYRPQVAQPMPAPTPQPKYAAPNGMLLIPLLSLIMIAAPVYMLTRKPPAFGRRWKPPVVKSRHSNKKAGDPPSPPKLLKEAKPLNGLQRDRPQPTEERPVTEFGRLCENVKDLPSKEQASRLREHFGVFGGARREEGRGRR